MKYLFYPFGELSAICNKFEIVIFKLSQLGRVLNLSFGKGLNENKKKKGFMTVSGITDGHCSRCMGSLCEN